MTIQYRIDSGLCPHEYCNGSLLYLDRKSGAFFRALCGACGVLVLGAE